MPPLSDPHDPANPTTPIESRRALRAMLLDARASLPDRVAHDAELARHLADLLRALPVKRLAAYWPTQGEFDALTVLAHWLGADATRHALLPVVTDKFSPLQFRRWTPECEMTPGAYNIPIPRSGEVETPDALLIPCVGFDAQRYRIGYGGGFYDRTLAALHAAGHRPRTIGIAFEANRLESIAPRSHDIALDCIVTERGVF
ncbi:5-formyltetrahydrofolate cyclo-ligase [Ralstonia mannitolilytica]|uniref:5-formyltetrahydrofolate cyclo-ligase n=1 Tax=Ralstonia mannitolilytica TaxID=105219 RepID=UPI0028F532BA|nr:5-formyltetrahydrofolate cyclo-ligase [Ralstonia mannitolilytica]CAJ0700225.1 5-formyltetrahydrofolate cyclo-ligase [Ralstonia mannitolilytica]